MLDSLSTTVNVLKFRILFFFFFGYQDWKSRCAYQNSKNEDPDQTASSEAD